MDIVSYWICGSVLDETRSLGCNNLWWWTVETPESEKLEKSKTQRNIEKVGDIERQ